MAYATAEDLLLSAQDLIALTDDAGNGTLDAAVVTANIQRADRLIDTYLRGRYITPFDPVPAEVREISAALAKYYLEQRRHSTATEGTRNEYKDALQVLKDLQSGRATLSEEGQTEDLDRGPGRMISNKTAESRVFSKADLNRF